MYFFANERVRISQVEPCGKKLPAILTPLMKAMMIGLGKKPAPMIDDIIGRRMMVTGVPARNADKIVEMRSVINTARKMLLFDKVTKPVEINSEKPNSDNEFERMNMIVNKIRILNEISFLMSKKS